MSAGRCTKGIYGTLLTNHKASKYILVIDTEGMLSIIKNDPKFDRKMALFCLAVSDIVLVNVKGEMNKTMTDLLTICTRVLEELSNTKLSIP